MPTPDQSKPFESPRAPAIKTAKSRAKAKATLSGEVRRHEQPVLVVGATGSFGGAVSRELISRGEKARLLSRSQPKAVRQFGSMARAELIEGDAQDTRAVVHAARGCRAVVHAVGFPAHKWDPNMLGVVANTLAAAQEHKIPLLYPANVWALGPQTEAVLDERADLLPHCDCNRVAIEIERTLRGAAEHDGAQVILLRMPDLFGPSVSNAYVDSVFGRAASGKHIKLLGSSDARHQWGFAPDAARVAVWLLDRAAHLRRFTTVHFKGYTYETNGVFLSRVAEIAGRADLPIKSIPWWQLRMQKAFAPDAKQFRDLRYLYERGVLLDDRVIQHAFEDYSNTDIDHAIGNTIAAYRERG